MSNSELKNVETASMIAFSSPLRWENGAHKNERAHWLGRMTEWLFDFGGEGHTVASTINCENAVKVNATVTKKPHWAMTAVKVCLLATGIIPLLFVVLKAIYRAVNNVVEVAPTTKKPPLADVLPPPVETSSSSSSSSSTSVEIRPYLIKNVGNTCWFGTFYQAICAVEPLKAFIQGYEGDDPQIIGLKNCMDALSRRNEEEIEQNILSFCKMVAPMLGIDLAMGAQKDPAPLLEWFFEQAGQKVGHFDNDNDGMLVEAAPVLRLQYNPQQMEREFQKLITNHCNTNGMITKLNDCLLIQFDRTGGGHIGDNPGNVNVPDIKDDDDEETRNVKIASVAGGQKFSNSLVFPENGIIDLSDCVQQSGDGEEYLYQLFSVVSHIGVGTEDGHYIAEAKYGEHWYRCSDHEVQEYAYNALNTKDCVYFVLKRITFD